MREVIGGIAAQENRHVVLLEHRLVGIAREPHGREQCGFPCTPVTGRVCAPRRRDIALEVRDPPAEHHAEPCGRLLIRPVELVEGVRKLLLRAAKVVRVDGRGDELVVARRHDDLDLVVEDDRHRVQQMLLVGTVERHRSLRGLAGELVDQLVDAARGERARRGAREHLSACQAHATGGSA